MSVLKIEPYATDSTANFVFNGLSVTSNISSGNANLGNTVTANYYYGNGVNLTGITATNANFANYAGTVTASSQPNITSVGSLSGLTVSGTTSLTGNVSISGNLAVTGNTTYVNSNVSVIQDPVIELGSGANGAILSSNDSMDRGTLLHYYTSTTVDAFMGWKSANNEFTFASNASVTNNVATINTLGNIRAGNAVLGNSVTSNYFIGSGNNLSNIQASNITGTVANANYSAYAGVVTTNAQPNITSVGTLNGVIITGVANLTGAGNVALGAVGNVHITGGSSGQYLQTDGSGALSWATISSASASISNGNSNVSIPSANGNVNISAVGNNVVVISGTGANISGTLNATGNANVGNLGATGVVATTLGGALTTASQPNVTSLGTLSGLNISGNAVIVGNLVVTGNTTYVNSNVTQIQDALIELGGGANGAALSSNDGFDRGTLLHYYTSTTVDAFMGWKNANSEFVFASNASVTNNVATINSLGNIRAGNANLGNAVTSNYFVGNGSLLTGVAKASAADSVANGLSNVNIASANANATISVNGTSNVVVVSNSGVNVSGYLTTTGNITSGNANLGNAVTSNYFIGSGNNLSNIQASNITGAIGNSNVANVSNYAAVTTQTTGTFYPVFVSGNTTGNYALGSNANLSYSVGNGTLVTGNINVGAGVGGNLTGANLVSANYLTGTLTTNAQPNITSVGTLASLNVTANISSANYILGNGYYLTGVTKATSADSVSNGTSNVNIASANANATISINGTSNVVVVSNTGVNVTGTVTATSFSGNGALLTGIGGAGYIFNGNSNVAIPSANSNIYVTVGTTSNTVVFSNTGINANGYITATGNISSGNANLGNAVTSNYFIGSGNNLSNIQAANITGTVANANFAAYSGNVTVNSQPNITSLGTLSSLTVSGLITATGTGIKVSNIQDTSGTNTITAKYNGNTGDVGITGNLVVGTSGSGNVSANYFIGDGSQLTGITTSPSKISNGNSNVNIGTANGNVTISAVGNANVVVVTGSSINVSGDMSVTGNIVANILTTNGGANLVISSSAPLVMSNSFTSNGNVNLTGANVSLGGVANIHITGGSANQYLKTDGSGVLSWGTPTGGGGGGGGTSITYTAAATPPGTANIADQWFNTTSNTLYEYMNDGVTNYWVDVTSPSLGTSSTGYNTAGFNTRTYVGSGSQTAYTISAGLSASSVIVTEDGVVQVPTTDYTVSGTTLTFITAPPNNCNIQIRELGFAIPVTAIAAAAGSNTQIQYNNLGLTAGSTNLTFNASTNLLNITGNISASGTITSTGDHSGANITATGNITSSGTITATGNLTSGNITSSGTITATGNLTSGNITTGRINSTSLRAQAMTMGILLGG